MARNDAFLDLGKRYTIALFDLFFNRSEFLTESSITAMQATTTLTYLTVDFLLYHATPENNRRVVEPLCRCLANLRRNNPNHPLRTLKLYGAHEEDSDVVAQILVAAKQFGIHELVFIDTRVPIQSLVEFGRDNTHLQRLHIFRTYFYDEESTISVSSQNWPLNSSILLNLDKLCISRVTFGTSNVVRQFLNFMALVTYPALALGEITVYPGNYDDHDDEEEEEEAHTTRLRCSIVSELIIKTSSLQQLGLLAGCRIEAMVATEACATVTQIRLCAYEPPIDFRRKVVQQKLRADHRDTKLRVGAVRGPPP